MREYVKGQNPISKSNCFYAIAKIKDVELKIGHEFGSPHLAFPQPTIQSIEIELADGKKVRIGCSKTATLYLVTSVSTQLVNLTTSTTSTTPAPALCSADRTFHIRFLLGRDFYSPSTKITRSKRPKRGFFRPNAQEPQDLPVQ